jgi:tellurite methyltransferase
MKKNLLIKYWNSFYKKNTNYNESSFARFIFKKFKIIKRKKIIDIGCGNGRDSFFFWKKNLDVTGLDISKLAIKNNSSFSNKNLKFLKHDINKKIFLKDKYDYIYSRFFLHAISQIDEKNLLNFINLIKKKNTYCFFEFRNHNDLIFKKKYNQVKHNNLIEFEKGHFRRVIDPNKFIETINKFFKIKIIYYKSSVNLSKVKNDNPNLSRIIFKFK